MPVGTERAVSAVTVAPGRSSTRSDTAYQARPLAA